MEAGTSNCELHLWSRHLFGRCTSISRCLCGWAGLMWAACERVSQLTVLLAYLRFVCYVGIQDRFTVKRHHLKIPQEGWRAACLVFGLASHWGCRELSPAKFLDRPPLRFGGLLAFAGQAGWETNSSDLFAIYICSLGFATFVGCLVCLFGMLVWSWELKSMFGSRTANSLCREPLADGLTKRIHLGVKKESETCQDAANCPNNLNEITKKGPKKPRFSNVVSTIDAGTMLPSANIICHIYMEITALWCTLHQIRLSFLMTWLDAKGQNLKQNMSFGGFLFIAQSIWNGLHKDITITTWVLHLETKLGQVVPLPLGGSEVHLAQRGWDGFAPRMRSGKLGRESLGWKGWTRMSVL